MPCNRRHLAQVHVEVFHLPLVDLLSGDGIAVVGQTELDAVRLGQRAIKLGPGGSAGPDANAERVARRAFGLDPRRQSNWNLLRVSCPGKSAHADGTA